MWIECIDMAAFFCSGIPGKNGYVDTASQAYNSGELKSIDEAIQNIKAQVTDGYNYITVD